MSAPICTFILTISALYGSRVVSGVLNRPTNVRLTSYNMNLMLMWDSPEEEASGLVYTTEYKTSVTSYRVGCVNISLLECDFTCLNISISEYGKYTARVRVQLGAQSSAWVESNQITLDKDTIIGSPSVSLFSNGATIEVSIKDPVFKISALRNIYSFTTYNITYWKDGQKAKARSISNIQQNRVVLNDLDLWTKYCTQVQINTERVPNPSEPSRTICESTTNVVSGVLNRPTNVRLTSYNMNLVLIWDSPEETARDLVYTTEYKTSVTSYRVGCVNISLLECDFTHLNISISEYGKYTGRVRAQLGAQNSAWVESDQITLDKDTIIGSPNVSLFSNGATIEVSIKDPVLKISELRNVYNLVTYNITYWKDGQKAKARSISNVQQNRVVLNDLELWTKYCAQVQINAERNPNPSKPSGTVCESTTNEKEVPWVAALVTFVVMAMAVALVVVTVVYWKRICHFLYPKDALPQHFKEYLLAPPNSPMYLAMRNSHPPEEIYHQVSIITGNRTVEEGSPLDPARTGCSSFPDVTVEDT